MAEKLTSKERFAYTVNSIDHAKDVLDLRQVRMRLGDYADRLAEFTDFDNIAFADVRDGELRVPSNNSQLPIAVFRPDEIVLRRPMERPLDDHQINYLEQHGGPYVRRWVEDSLKTSQHNNPHDFPADRMGYLPTLGTAHAVTVSLNWANDDHYAMQGRPIVVYNAKPNRPPFAAAPVTLHEFMHVRQFRETPLRYLQESSWTYEQYQVAIELEAYYVMAMTILGIQDAGREREFLANLRPSNVKFALDIEHMRKNVNMHEDNPFEPSPEIIDGLVADNLAITDSLKQRIESKTK